MKTRAIHLRVVSALVLLPITASCGPVQRAVRGYADVPSVDVTGDVPAGSMDAGLVGQRRLVLDDFGSLDTDRLNTYGVPWKLAAAALVMHRAGRDGSPVSDATLRSTLREFGFLFPEQIENWRGPNPRRSRLPIGVLSGTASRGFPAVEIEIAGLGCASCHAGVTYDASGMPTGDVWLGLPNTSLDITAYGDTLFAALRQGLAEPQRLIATVRALYPDVSDRELRTLERHAIPRGRTRLATLDSLYGRALPFVNGGPGITNGVASLRHMLGSVALGSTPHAWVSIPYIGDRHLRSSFLADGVYAVPGDARFVPRSQAEWSQEREKKVAGIIAFFTVPTQGVSPETARRAHPAMQDVARFISEIRPPRFPGAIDSVRAREGERLYRASCSSCHGEVTPGLEDARLVSFPNVLVPGRDIGTDPSRWSAVDSASLQKIEDVGFAGWIDAAPTGGYVAPPLTSVWATAPYLHNGSVPTLWQLMNPELRAPRFQLGGHALDFTDVGIAGAAHEDGVYRYDPGYRPWAQPSVYDTRLPGRANGGHEKEFAGLTPAQKRSLIEYLKLL
jgi:hypothetical protein